MKSIRDFIKNKKKYLIIIIYLIALIIFNIKIDYYQKTINEFPDESSHIAYIAYLEETKKIIPEFENMQEMKENAKTETNEFEEGTTNHLGHPPLYYHLMKLFNIVQVEDGKITYDLNILRTISQIISNIALILAFIIGYSKLKSIFANFVYVMFIVTIPLFSYISGAVQNDVISFLGVNIYILGMMNLVDKKRNYLTYFLIAIGTFICLLNKLTVRINCYHFIYINYYWASNKRKKSEIHLLQTMDNYITDIYSDISILLNYNK